MSAPDFRTLMVENWRAPSDQSLRQFASIPAGTFRLSVQASRTHYCSPRDVRPVGEYSAFEIAILRTGKMLHPSEALTDCPHELVEGWESGSNPVGACIPVERIQRLFELLCEATP